MSEGVDEKEIRVVSHRPGIDIVRAQGDLGKILKRTPAETEKLVLGEIPIEESVRRRYKSDGAGGIIELESEEPVQK